MRCAALVSILPVTAPLLTLKSGPQGRVSKGGQYYERGDNCFLGLSCMWLTLRDGRFAASSG
jgi:hypothetical protein